MDLSDEWDTCLRQHNTLEKLAEYYKTYKNGLWTGCTDLLKALHLSVIEKRN